MALGRRAPVQERLFVAAKDLPRSPGHAFYTKLNALLAEADFDRRIEALCEPHYAAGVGRPSLPPGVYFRMLFVGFFEGLGSQRAIAWRCADSLSVRAFLGLALDQRAPDHASLTYIRRRLPAAVYEQGFQLVLEMARRKGLLKGKTLAVDSTTLEANAAMRSMVHRVSHRVGRFVWPLVAALGALLAFLIVSLPAGVTRTDTAARTGSCPAWSDSPFLQRLLGLPANPE